MTNMEPNPVNDKILDAMRDSIAALPPTPKAARSHKAETTAADHPMTIDEETSAELVAGAPVYPSKREVFTRIPSFRQTAELLKKYPSLSMVRQMSSGRGRGWDLRKSTDDVMAENAVLPNQEGKNATMTVPSASPTPPRLPRRVASLKEQRPMEGLDDDDDKADATTATWNEMDIEVLPGITKRLRSGDETFRALRQGKFIETPCLMCSVQLQCLSDVEGVICPLCLSMSPLENLQGKGNGTVALGIEVQ